MSVDGGGGMEVIPIYGRCDVMRKIPVRPNLSITEGQIFK